MTAKCDTCMSYSVLIKYDVHKYTFSDLFLSIEKCRQNIVSSPLQNEDGDNSGQVDKISLVLHGTKQVPAHVLRAGGKRHYDYSYNNVHNERDVSITIVQATADGDVTRLPVWPLGSHIPKTCLSSIFETS